MISILWTLPLGSASACAMGGSSCAMGSSGMVGAALLGAVSALGWAVLRYASKEAGPVKTAGQVVGWILAVGGIAGFLCGAACHAMSKLRVNKSCDHAGPSAGALPPGHPPIEPAPR